MLGDTLNKIKGQGGYLSHEDIAALATQDRQRMILVRLGNGRFIAPAQNIKHLTDIIERNGHDYVRDVSLTADDPIYK